MGRVVYFAGQKRTSLPSFSRYLNFSASLHFFVKRIMLKSMTLFAGYFFKSLVNYTCEKRIIECCSWQLFDPRNPKNGNCYFFDFGTYWRWNVDFKFIDFGWKKSKNKCFCYKKRENHFPWYSVAYGYSEMSEFCISFLQNQNQPNIENVRADLRVFCFRGLIFQTDDSLSICPKIHKILISCILSSIV